MNNKIKYNARQDKARQGIQHRHIVFISFNCSKYVNMKKRKEKENNHIIIPTIFNTDDYYPFKNFENIEN